MRIDFNGAEGQLSDFVTVPAGTYLCEIAEVRAGTTRNGDDRWGIRLVVADGEFVGRHAAWDGLVFSARAKPRLRRALRAFGLPADGEVEIEPDQLVGRRALVRIEPDEYQDPETGTRVRRNTVPYDGFLCGAGSEAAEPDDGDGAGDPTAEIPF